MRILHVVGARPNFMKIAPLLPAFSKYRGVTQYLIHTGQHYDDEMSKRFFLDLDIKPPDIFLGVGSGSHAEQTGKIMIAFEKVLCREKPDWVVVMGDVNSTLAAALVCAKERVRLAHVEAGLRSFDRTMAEEVNRIVTDRLSNALFTTSEEANENLKREGISEDKIFFVGNIMIDSLVRFRQKAENSPILKDLQLAPKTYAVMTLHRPTNVDEATPLRNITQALRELQQEIRIIFPVHPRCAKNLERLNLKGEFSKMKNVTLVNPLGYLDFLKLSSASLFVMTDSGGVQEETTFLDVPCLTLRENTERPVTVTQGTNEIVGNDPERIVRMSRQILQGRRKTGRVPDLWDGQTAERIAAILMNGSIK